MLLAASVIPRSGTTRIAVAEEAAAASARCEILATLVVPPATLGSATVVALGGISDLSPDGASSSGASLRLWAVTDRGPNGTTKSAGATRRTLLAPDFVPALVALDVARDTITGRHNGFVGRAGVASIMPLAGRSGRPLSGRPNGIGRDEPILDAGGATEVAPDPNGIDSEGLVRLRDGRFWIAEEYRPSLLEVSPEGVVLARYLPKGDELPGADTEICPVLPATYGRRRDNRGFEALAVSPDEARLWALLQSPLETPVPRAARTTGNVRLFAFDLRTRRPAAEYVYRLGDPSDPNYLPSGAPPADGKLCAMAAIDTTTLLVLEQSHEGVVRLYACSLAEATDTLPLSGKPTESWPPLEEIGDLRRAGIVPVAKTLVTDLAPLRPAMEADVYGGSNRPDDGKQREVKLEGLAILGPDLIVLVNDNDFGVHASNEVPKTCLWILQVDGLPSSQPAEPSIR